jgi:large repetitive protein
VDTTTVTIVDDVGALELTITSPANAAMIATREPTITGFTAPNASIEVFVDGVSVGTTTADANGDWSFVVPAASALVLGMHEVEVVATSGQDTATVAINVEVIDATMTPVMIAMPAMGALTNDDTPTVTGTAAPGATVEVFVDGASIGTAVADANGAWTLDAPMLTDGMHTIEARAGGSTASVGITVDTMAPVTTVSMPTTGGAVTTGTPVITGTGEPGSTVTISIDGMVVGTATVGADGMWTFTPTTALGEGMHTISVVGQDEAGNLSEPVEVQISVEQPVVAPMVAVTSPAPGATVTDTTPTITGTATPGATVEILVDGAVIGTTVADASGQWSFTPDAALEDGTHTIEARVTIEGESTTSAPITITVDGGDVTPEDSGLVLAGGGCASAPGDAPDAAPAAALGLFALLGWRRRRR